MTDHPTIVPPTTIVPPRELKQQWLEQAPRYRDCGVGRAHWLIDRAAQWVYEQCGKVNEAQLQKARDEELEACCEVVSHWYGDWANGINLPIMLRAARRPKPPSLKEQAMQEFDHLMSELVGTERYKDRISIIRRALEALADD